MPTGSNQRWICKQAGRLCLLANCHFALYAGHASIHDAFAIGALALTVHGGQVMGSQTCHWRSRFGVYKRWFFSVGVAVFLLGCETVTLTPPKVDQVRFSPMPAAKRTIAEPKVKYLPRHDGFEYCSRITGVPITPTSRPMACAFWNVRRQECTIVTPMSTGYNYLGHELRHCFEGAFHD